MGSSSKKSSKDKDSRKRRHSPDDYHEISREKRHKHHKHKHHKEKRREKSSKHDLQIQSDDSDVVEIIPNDPPQAPPPIKERYSEKSYQEKSTEPSSGQGSESLSIEETNKLRAKLGLKPLDIGSSSNSGSSKSKDDKIKDDLGEFYHKPAENLVAKAEQEKFRSRLVEQREKRKLQDKYSKIKTLGESDSDDDALNWVDKNRKIEQAKKEAEKRAKMLEELDAQFGISEVMDSEQRQRRNQQYTTKDLRGLRVDHDVDTFAEERDVILTLKDKDVLAEDDDVLVNVNMIDNEKYKKNVEVKKKKVHYNPYEDQEYDEFGNPKEKSLLSKYDEEIEGEKRESFRIGYDDAVERKKEQINTIKEKLAKTKFETIIAKDLTLASDYFNEEELTKFKKPKKKNRKIRSKGKLTADDLLEPAPNTGIEKIGSRRPKFKNEVDLDIDDVPSIEVPTDIKFEDDKDEILEKSLHRARKIKQKENLVAEIIKTELKTDPDEDNIDSGNIVLNSTAEFCRTLGDIPTYGKAGNRDDDEDLIDFDKDLEKEEISDDDCQVIEPTGWNSVDPSNQGIDSTQIARQEVQILDEEPDVSTGVGAALKLAMSKGYLDKEQNNRPSNSRFAHLQAQHYSIEDKSYGDDDRGGRGRERYAGPITDFRERDGFKPNVKLEYIDDEGHILNAKEAFRYLSHKFHGKGPGKNKVEKRIKKGVQEQLMKKMSSTDTPLGTLNMLQAKQKETQSPFVVLSGSKSSTVISKARQ